MKKISFHSIIIFSCLLLIGACKRVCENIKVGETHLSQEVLSFFPYSDGQEIEFINENGEIKTFTVQLQESSYHICKKITCRPVDPYKSNFCEYIEAPLKEMYLLNDSTLLGIDMSVFAYEKETDLFYESVRLQLSHVNKNIHASWITDVRFVQPTFDKESINDIDHFLVLESSKNILNQNFDNILFYEESDMGLYFQKDTGFIGFKIDGLFWLMKA